MKQTPQMTQEEGEEFYKFVMKCIDEGEYNWRIVENYRKNLIGYEPPTFCPGPSAEVCIFSQ